MIGNLSYEEIENLITIMASSSGNIRSVLNSYQDNNNISSRTEKFLTEYNGYKCKLIVLMEGCNVSNGYPYWIFHWKEIK